MFLSLERKAVLRENKGSFKKRVFQKALREMGFYALCSGSKKLITHSASNFGVIFFLKKIRGRRIRLSSAFTGSKIRIFDFTRSISKCFDLDHTRPNPAFRRPDIASSRPKLV